MWIRIVPISLPIWSHITEAFLAGYEFQIEANISYKIDSFILCSQKVSQRFMTIKEIIYKV